MKKLFLSLLACGTIAVAQAQPGSILAYGDLGLSMHTDSAANPTKSMNFTINPGIGYQFNKNWTAGIFVNFGTMSETPDGGVKSSLRTIGGGLFGRYTKYLGEHFFLFGQAQAGYLQRTVAIDGETVEGIGESGFNVNLFPAAGIFICHGFALNFSFGGLGYTSMKQEGEDNSSSTFDLTFGKTMNFGVSMNFGGKKAKGHHGMMDDTRHVDTSDDEDEAPKKKKASRDDDDE